MTTPLLRIFKPILFVLMAAFILQACKKNNAINPPSQAETPQVTSIQPKNPQPGDVVTITGTGFGTTAADVKVTVGTKTITITSVTPTEIKFTVPADLTSGELALTIKDMKAAIKDPQGMAITVTPKPVTTPTFTAMAPTSGKTGDVITLTGTNFSTLASDNKVFFATQTGGTVVLGTIKTVTSTQITVEVPANAITGGILIDVKGTNAVPAAGFNTTFTINATTGGASGVDYIVNLSGNLKFNKIATSTNEIQEMYFDKVKNLIYYTDYSLLNTAGKLYKQDPTGNNPAVVLTTDARINKVVKIASDAQGNVYTLQYLDNTPSNYDVYKISADGNSITEIKKNFDVAGKYFFFINAANEVCIRPDLKITQSGELINTANKAQFGLQQAVGGAYYNTSTAYLVQTTDNTSTANKAVFIKWNLGDGTVSDAGFSLKDLFNADDATQFSTNNNITKLKIAADDSNNIYALMDHSYIAGSTKKTWMLRKAKAGNNSSTLLGTFSVKVPTWDLTDVLGLVFVADGNGNMYIKANQKDIIKISQ